MLVAEYTITDKAAAETPSLPLHLLEQAHYALVRAGARGEFYTDRQRWPHVGGGAWYYGVFGVTDD